MFVLRLPLAVLGAHWLQLIGLARQSFTTATAAAAAVVLLETATVAVVVAWGVRGLAAAMSEEEG